jgi:MoaA/NifB/PqqE/SkfB family radical SAM enzyme
MPKNKTFCIKPWTHGCIKTNGDILLCCKSFEQTTYNLKTHTIQEWWNSDFVTNVRKQFLSNQQPDVCRGCFEQEEAGIDSLRNISNREYKIFEQYADKTIAHLELPKNAPIEVELQLTNLCNLKCLTCIESDSSSILSENKKLKISTSNQKDYSITADEIKQLKEYLHTQPRLIILRGGEPMIVPEIKELLQYAADNNLTDKTIINFVTNGTRFDQQWFNILSKFKQVRIQLSVDGIDKVGEYIRYGSNWELIQKNAKWMSTIPEVNLFIHATLSNLNILSIGNLVNWCNENNYYFQYDTVIKPDQFTPSNLPYKLLDLARERLRTINNPIAKQIMSISHTKFNDTYWSKFKDEITMRDQIRSNSILSVIPELEPYWNN